ncbi:hypothetical protein BST33_10140 [Mycolicibacter minnesotensis]|uniref:DUF7159 domain-containing protein n=1 Tax=Mycolicibacter minnesotensis TaxID=1118379 RepID=A0A7I7R3Z2_9MYCO|nr:hypothetical protein [Mycolicibacter minnesotensis]ORB01117.1 hypothetical protein BST33_10140 [Mycolicibacter minnesotensis]BBY33338.1 hypothetical protein MMIN_13990 [Mycolicibacter minnesotensis]
MDVVLGVALASSAPATIHTVLVCGENGDGVTLEERSYDVPTEDTEFAAVDALIAAILRARDAADTAGHHLTATGVTVTDPLDAAALNSRLSTGALASLENLALISPVLAAASLAHNLGQTVGCDQMGLLSVETATATLAVVDCTDGTVTQIFRAPLADGDATAAIDTVADQLNAAQTHPGGLFLICSDGDSTALRPRLEETIAPEVCEPAEPRSALARGAALASARLVAASVSSGELAYTQEPASGALHPSYYDIPGSEVDELAYSLVPDEEAEAATEFFAPVGQPARRPLLVVGAALASAAFAAASALMVAMTLEISPNLVALRPDLGRALALPHRAPNLQVPAVEPFGGPPPVMGQAPADSVPLPPLSLPPMPEIGGPAPLDSPDPGLPAPMPVGSVTPPLFVPAPVFGPPLPGLQPPAVHTPSPFIVGPILAAAPRRPVVTGLPDLSFLWGVPMKKPPAPPVVKPTPPDVKPDPPVVTPKPPIELPDPPVVKPQPPVIKPEPPIVKPTPPVIKPNPPVVKPIPPVIKPNPPVQLPDPPVSVPDVPIKLPDPPATVPDVAIKLPEAPVQLPTPPVANPNPSLQLPGLPLQPPISAPPVGLPAIPAPSAPTFPGLPAIPAPSAPVIPAAPSVPAFTPPALPSLPAPQAPSFPSLPAPQAPSLPSFPSLPAPQAPALPSIPAPSAPSMPKLGGGLFGGGGKPGGIFGGGGNPGGGLFGGGGRGGGGLFGGGGGGGLFGGGGGGGLFGGGGRGGGLFGH